MFLFKDVYICCDYPEAAITKVIHGAFLVSCSCSMKHSWAFLFFTGGTCSSIYIFAHIHLYKHYLWYTLNPTICFVDCWKSRIFFVAPLMWGLNWTSQIVFLGKPEKLIVCVPVSVNIFKKKKRKSRTLLKLLGEVGAEIFMTNVLKMFSLRNRRELPQQ